MLHDAVESSRIVKTWIGQSVNLACSVTIKAGTDSPTFIWINDLKNKTITENISGTRTKSILTLKPQNEDDFGSYMCRARTAHTKIDHNITLVKISKLIH